MRNGNKDLIEKEKEKKEVLILPMRNGN